jgi:uncharacterized protein (TIGR03437 family)
MTANNLLLRVRALIVISGLCLLPLARNAQGTQIQPVNNNFAESRVIVGSFGSLTDANTGATKETGEPTHAGNAGGTSVWFRWQAPMNGPIVFSTRGSSFNTLLAAYDGVSLGALTRLAANDDFSGETSQIRFNAVAGRSYRIVVDGKNGGSGNIILKWNYQPANDDFPNVQPIVGASGSLLGSNIGATKEANEPLHHNNAGGASVWFRWQAPVSGKITFSTFGSDFDTVLAVYTGGALNQLTRIASNDDSSGRTSRLDFPALGGTTYYIALDGHDGGIGSFTLSWTTPPANDNFAASRVISGSSGSVTGSNSGASKEPPGEPNHADNAGGNSVWFRWQTPASGQVTFTTLGSNFDTLLAVYTGSAVNQLTRRASNNNQPDSKTSLVTFAATAGQTYQISVDGLDGQTGNLVLLWAFAPLNDNFANAQVLIGSSGNVIGNNIGASVEPGEFGKATVWYRWTAPFTGSAVFNSSDSDFGTRLIIYTGSSIASLTLVEVGTSRFHAVAGTTYQILVDGNRGNIKLTWSLVPSPSNDDYFGQEPISGPSGSLVRTTLGATGGDSDPNSMRSLASVWFRWVAPANGRIVFSVSHPAFSPLGGGLIEASTFSSIFGFPLRLTVATNSGTYKQSIQFTTTAGKDYFIVVAVPYNVSGEFTLRWFAPPANDNFANAQPISGISGRLVSSNLGTNKEVGEPNHGGEEEGDSSIWYRWQAPVNGVFNFTAQGEGFSTNMGVYTGTSVNALTPLPGSDNRIEQFGAVLFNATAGTTYFIAVDSRYGEGAFTLNWASSSLSLPSNDNFANAQVLTGTFGSVTGSNVGATREPTEPFAQQNASTVWYRWQAPANGLAVFSTFGSDFDSSLSIYTGTGLTNLTAVGSGFTIRDRYFNAVAGTIYQIRVNGDRLFKPPQGRIVLSWRLGPPINDNFSAAQLLAGNTGSVTGNNLGATRELGEPDHADVRSEASIWYRWQAPATGSVTFTTAGSATDTLLAVYTGNSVSLLSPIAANDDFLVAASSVTFQATAGVTYRIAVNGVVGNTGNIALSWNLGAPSNDNFANAQILSGLTGITAGNNIEATREAGESNHAGQPSRRSVWYRWQAPVSGAVTFATVTSSFDTILAVYTGTAVNSAVSVASNDDDAQRGLLTSRVTFTATANETYRIAVDGANARAGNIFLRWNVGASIRGTVFTGTALGDDGPGIPNIIVQLSGDDSQRTVTDARGNYTFASLRVGGNYSVNCFPQYSPGLRDYRPLTSDVEDADFRRSTGILSVSSFSGHVRNAQGVGLTGITVALSGGRSETIVTGRNGSYRFDDLETALEYFITPISVVHRFTPPQYIKAPQQANEVIGATFRASESFTISGQVSEGNGAPVANVTVSLLGSQAQPVLTDADGNYSFIVPAGGAYTVVPSRVNYSFIQQSELITNLSANRKDVNFIAINETCPAITGLNPSSSRVGQTITISGTGFSGISAVLFGGNANAQFSVLNSNTITAIVPLNATTGSITLVKSNCTSIQTVNFTVLPPNPTISLSPATLTVGVGSTQSLTVSLSAAQTTNTIVALACSNTAVATVPVNVTIPANDTSASFSVSGVVAGGPVSITVTLAANLGGSSASASVQVINQGLEADVAPRPNGNGSLSLTDWVQTGRFISGADTPAAGSEFQRADCAPKNTAGNGSLSLTDWVQAGRYAAGLDEPVPAAGPTAPNSAFSFPGSFTGEDFAAQLLKRLNRPDARTLRLRTRAETPGAESSVQIELDAPGGENAIGFSLSFDAARWRLLSVATEIESATLLVNRTQLKAGKLGIAMALNALETLPPGKHLLVTLRLAPLSPRAGSGDFSFSDSPINREAAGAAADSLPLNFAREDERPLTVVSAANFSEQRLARDSIAVAIANNLHGQTGGTQVWLLDAKGVEHSAPLLSVSPEQIAFQIPADAATGSARLAIRNQSGPSEMVFATQAEIVEAAPAVFSTTLENQRWPAAALLRIHSDGRLSYDPIWRLAFGEEEQLILVLFGTGLRHHQGRVSAQIGAIQLPVLYAGPQGEFAGLDQLNLSLPRSLAGSGEMILKLSVDGHPANPLRLVIN